MFHIFDSALFAFVSCGCSLESPSIVYILEVVVSQVLGHVICAVAIYRLYCILTTYV